jgi:hypothetical protein
MSSSGSHGALQKLKASREQQRAHPTQHAASSHVKNDEYMNSFHKALLEHLPNLSAQEDQTIRPPGPEASKIAKLHAQRQEYVSPYTSTVVDGWLTGPVDEAGTLSLN